MSAKLDGPMRKFKRKTPARGPADFDRSILHEKQADAQGVAQQKGTSQKRNSKGPDGRSLPKPVKPIALAV